MSPGSILLFGGMFYFAVMRVQIVLTECCNRPECNLATGMFSIRGRSLIFSIWTVSDIILRVLTGNKVFIFYFISLVTRSNV